MPRVLVANILDGNVSFFDATTRKALGKVAVGPSPQGMALAKNGRFGYVTGAGEGTFSVLDVIRMKETERISFDGIDDPGSVAVLPDGRSLIVRSVRGDALAVADARTGKARHRVELEHRSLGPFAVTGSGSRASFAAPGGDHIISYDPRSGELAETTRIEGGPCGVALARDGRTLVACLREPARVAVLRDGNTRPSIEVAVGENPVDVVAHPYADKAFVLAKGGGSIFVVDLGSGTAEAPIPVGLGPVAMAVAKAGKMLYVTNGDSDNVSVVDVTRREVMHTWPTGHNPGPVSFV